MTQYYEQSLDQLFLRLRADINNTDWDDAKSVLSQMKERISTEIASTQRWHVVREIEKAVNGNKDAFILDFGCGGGQSVVYFYLLGYKNIYGADMVSQKVPNEIMKLLGVENMHCLQYDGGTLPLETNKFDAVFSEQVLEHVLNIPQYYAEAGRVIKSGASAYFTFPHKFTPYEKHGGTWFLHMFPKPITYFFYRLLGRDVEGLRNTLNLQSISYHKNIALKYFVTVENKTVARLQDFTGKDLNRYQGNKNLRKIAQLLIKQRWVGPIALKLLSSWASVSLVLKNK